MEFLSWEDFFGEEHLLVEGKDDDVFHVIPGRLDDEGNSYTQILSKKAIIEYVEKIKAKEIGK